jgi:translation initiation factor 2-alpha kinase 4
LRTTGLDILQQLWSSDISAELACDARNPDDLLLKYKDDQHTWIVIIKQDGVVKIKSIGQKDVPDVDVPISQLVGWIKAELRDRDHREGNYERAKHARQAIQGEGSIAKTSAQEVKVLSAQAKSKKGNRQNVVEQAQVRAATLAQTFLEGPILAIETTDQVLELIKTTRLSDPDSWKKVVQSVSNSERRYIDDVQSELKTMAYNKKDVTNAFIYNFRTSTCIFYDLNA